MTLKTGARIERNQNRPASDPETAYPSEYTYAATVPRSRCGVFFCVPNLGTAVMRFKFANVCEFAS